MSADTPTVVSTTCGEDLGTLSVLLSLQISPSRLMLSCHLPYIFFTEYVFKKHAHLPTLLFHGIDLQDSFLGFSDYEKDGGQNFRYHFLLLPKLVPAIE